MGLQIRPILNHVATGLTEPDTSSAIEYLLGGLQLPRQLAAERLGAVWRREQQASTFIGCETALPHARIPAGEPWQLAFGCFTQAVPWGEDGQPVRLVFLSLVPGNVPVAYLGFVKKLNLALRNEVGRKQLLAARTHDAVRQWMAMHLDLQ